ncbi:MAG: acyltransferase [Aeriscardovia sp.]|nr:acyltransferase [Aeriscardovia sp.]
MGLRTLLWTFLTDSYPKYLRKIYGMHIGKDCRISWKAHLDKSINPKGIFIGDGTQVLNGAMILSHDACRGIKADTHIGKNCVIGVRSIILPGITIGDSCVVGAGSVVTKDVDSNSIVAGNPAQIVRKGVKVNNRGQIIEKGIKV